MDLRLLTLQGVAVLLGLGILAVGMTVLDLQPGEGPTPIYLGVLFVSYFVIFAGAHVYLAARGEGGDVPVDARWRFIGTVAVILGLGIVGALATTLQPVEDVDPAFVVGVIALLVLVSYLVYEAREGFRAVQASESDPPPNRSG